MMHHIVYSRYVISNSLLDLYISILLSISIKMDAKTKTTVSEKVTESPSPNHAVSENGIYMLRNTMANRTEKVTVPISWYLPSRYDGSFWFIKYTFGRTSQSGVGANVEVFEPKIKLYRAFCGVKT